MTSEETAKFNAMQERLNTFLGEMAAQRRRRRKPRPPALYQSPISIPEGTSGSMEVKHSRVSGEVPIVGFRQGFLRGVQPVRGMVENRLVHELHEKDAGLWMTDMPEELEQIAQVCHEIKPAGRVLIGGLGLGVLAAVARTSPRAFRVDVVEISQDVIRLCRPPKPRNRYEVEVRVIVADITEFLRSCRKPYDTIFLDTWRGTGEHTWWTEVMPMRRIIANRWGKVPVWCWAEDIMLGQCFRAAFVQGGKHWYYRALPEEPSPREVKRFFEGVGLPWWEKKYGKRVDEVAGEERAIIRKLREAS